MGTHVSFILMKLFHPYFGGLKPAFFMVLGSRVPCEFARGSEVQVARDDSYFPILNQERF